MARFRRIDVYHRILTQGLVPVFYHADKEVVSAAIKSCYEGGARCFEFTHRGDLAHRVFEDVYRDVSQEFPDLMLGVGSIGDPHTAALYLAAGASFVVGPVLHPEVAKLCNRRKVAYSPGCGSATEIASAEELGCEIVKVFPGDSVGGPSFVRSVLGPCPWSSLMPTGGVEPTRESLRAWFQAGAAAVGIGSKLLSKDVVLSGDWGRLSRRVREVLAWIGEVRGEQAS